MSATALSLLALLALAGNDHGRLEQDPCAQKRISCEKDCDARQGMNRLHCKTDCRISESECRSGKKR